MKIVRKLTAAAIAESRIVTNWPRLRNERHRPSCHGSRFAVAATSGAPLVACGSAFSGAARERGGACSAIW